MIIDHLHVLAATLLCSLLASACGGAGGIDHDAAVPPQATAPSVAAAFVQLEGTVVGPDWMAASDVAVHVRTADGRIVGTAFSNARGVFVLTVPARTALVSSTDVEGRCEMSTAAAGASLVLATCSLAQV